jgi:hypothetical protein
MKSANWDATGCPNSKKYQSILAVDVHRTVRLPRLSPNVRGEPVFSVMAAGWFCEKSGGIGEVEDVKPVLLETKWISTSNHFEEEDFHPDGS